MNTRQRRTLAIRFKRERLEIDDDMIRGVVSVLVENVTVLDCGLDAIPAIHGL
jgi:hypothetical protein